MKQFNGLEEDLQLYLGDYSALNLGANDYGWEEQGNNIWDVNVDIHSDFIKPTLHLFFRLTKDSRKILCGYENGTEEDINGETLYRELFFETTRKL